MPLMQYEPKVATIKLSPDDQELLDALRVKFPVKPTSELIRYCLRVLAKHEGIETPTSAPQGE